MPKRTIWNSDPVSGLLTRNQQRFNDELKSDNRRWLFSPGVVGGQRVTLPLIEKYAHGKVIDIGCGEMPYRDVVLGRGLQYDSIDVERRHPDVRFIGDIENMDVLGNESYDTVLCLQVLEHVAHPFKVVREIHRILRPGGTLILSVPHLSRLHEEPRDFFRYTKHALRSMFEESGYEVVEITHHGGLFCFLGHQLSTMLVLAVWHIPVLKHVAFFLNRWLITEACWGLDKLVDRKKLFALGYSCVYRKAVAGQSTGFAGG